MTAIDVSRSHFITMVDIVAILCDVELRLKEQLCISITIQ
jgi:hypothetical protein